MSPCVICLAPLLTRTSCMTTAHVRQVPFRIACWSVFLHLCDTIRDFLFFLLFTVQVAQLGTSWIGLFVLKNYRKGCAGSLCDAFVISGVSGWIFKYFLGGVWCFNQLTEMLMVPDPLHRHCALGRHLVKGPSANRRLCDVVT